MNLHLHERVLVQLPSGGEAMGVVINYHPPTHDANLALIRFADELPVGWFRTSQIRQLSILEMLAEASR